MRYVPTLAVVLMHLIPAHALGSGLSVDSLLVAHRYEMTVEDGALSGSGKTFLLDALRDCQFLAIAEEHNLRELNELSRLLFDVLNELGGFNYVALEQGSVIGSWLGEGDLRGDFEAIASFVSRYPHAPTFATDEELLMIAAVGKTSTAPTTPIWGVDQELGALHILERLAGLAPTDEARSFVETLSIEARKHELDRSNETHYVAEVLTPAELETLSIHFGDGSQEATPLITALQRTNRIYRNHLLSTNDRPKAYENGREREESMKLRFMESYRLAQASGDERPRVLAKLGHWHVYRGIYRANVPTFGNFLTELAISNGMHALIVTTSVIESPEAWRNAGGPLAANAGDATFTLFDFRALRPYAHQGLIEGLSETLMQTLFRADVALVVRGGRTGSYTVVRRNIQ